MAEGAQGAGIYYPVHNIDCVLRSEHSAWVCGGKTQTFHPGGVGLQPVSPLACLSLQEHVEKVTLSNRISLLF